MTKNKSTKNNKLTAKKSQEIKIRKEKEELHWGGMKLFKQPAQGLGETMQMILLISRAYNVPPMGVNILGSQPYFNKTGLRYKFDEYKEQGKLGDAEIGLRWIKISKSPEEPAIVEAILYKNGQKTHQRVIGEANVRNVSLPAVKNSLNMMAETRAKNRLIREVIEYPMLKELDERLKKLQLAPNQYARIIDASKASAEEMDGTVNGQGQVESQPQKSQPPATTNIINLINTFKKANNPELAIPNLERLKKTVNEDARLTDANRTQLLGEIGFAIANLQKRNGAKTA